LINHESITKGKSKNKITMKNTITLLLVFAGLVFNPQTQPQLEVVAQLPIRPGNVAVSHSGRVFATIHPLGSSEIQLVEIKSPTDYRPYPDASFQKNGKPATDAALDTPLGITFDKNDNLWVIDMGQTLGKTRIWNFDIKHNTVIQKIELSEAVAPKGSFIQDIAVDEDSGWAYLADIASPGIITVNLKTKEARRFGGHPALQSEDIDMVIDGKVTHFGGAPARVAVNPITLSADRQTLYFGAMNGTKWYGVGTKLFREGATDAAIGKAINIVGPKPISDGVATDAKGNHYFTDLTRHAISALTAKGKLQTLITDARLLWPDNVAVANGYVYISVNQLNTTPAFTGKADEGAAPFFIYRFKNLL
jgi:sugar lactone lactonase YvrE